LTKQRSSPRGGEISAGGENLPRGASVESAKELAPEFLQHLPDIRVIEVLGIPVQKTTLRRRGFGNMVDD
jgi:hypothetical protein